MHNISGWGGGGGGAAKEACAPWQIGLTLLYCFYAFINGCAPPPLPSPLLPERNTLFEVMTCFLFCFVWGFFFFFACQLNIFVPRAPLEKYSLMCHGTIYTIVHFLNANKQTSAVINQGVFLKIITEFIFLINFTHIYFKLVIKNGFYIYEHIHLSRLIFKLYFPVILCLYIIFLVFE